MSQLGVVQAHKHCSYHREEVIRSEICGCFYCLSVFKPIEIEEWIDEKDGIGQTAMCPRCGIDSVIGSDSGISITREFLEKMHQHWF